MTNTDHSTAVSGAETSAVVVSQEQFRRPSWERSVAFDDAAADCERAIEGSTFAPGTSEERQEGYKTACRLMSMSMKLAASRAAPDGFTSTPQAASAIPDGWKLVPVDDASRELSDSALPEAMIDAGIDVLDKVQVDTLDYTAGETTDWDDGMIAVAVYRAMLAASPECPQAGSADVREADEPTCARCARGVCHDPHYEDDDWLNKPAAVPAHAPSAGEVADSGASACPICGKDSPHYHSPEEVERHRETEAWVEKSWQEFRPTVFPDAAAPTGNGDAESGS